MKNKRLVKIIELWFKNKIIDIVERQPPHIIGNGINTVSQLIDIYNKKQLSNGDYKVHNYNKQLIKKQGFQMSSIVPNNKSVILTQTINYHNGSPLVRIPLSKVNAENLKMFKKINKVLKLTLSGIDYMSPSLEIPYYQKGHIIEVNPGPDMKIHYKADLNNLNYAPSRFTKLIFG